MKLREILQKRGQAIDAMNAMNELAQSEGRDFTDEDKSKWADLEKQVASFEAMAERSKKMNEMVKFDIPDDPADPVTTAVTSQPDQPIYRGSKSTQLGQQLLDIRTISMPGVSHREYIDAKGRLDQCQKRAEVRAAATGGFTIDVPSEGAFTLQGETSIDLMTAGFNNSEILRRCSRRTLGAGTQFVEAIGLDETSRATGSRGGGVRVYTSRELEELTVSKTKFQKIRLEPKKLTGAYVASSEVMNNVTFLGQEMSQLFAEEFAFKAQDLVLNGTGAGEPLGVLNAGCLVSQAKETGQASKTIVLQNILNMESRIYQEKPGLVWIINRECKPQLAQLSMIIGTGGAQVPLYQQTYNMGNTIATLNGIPCVTIEQAQALGTVGDIMLCDFSQYLVVDRGGVTEDSSIHVYFLYDQNVFRFIYYMDGQPRWASTLTPYKGSNTVSPFIALATRS